MKRGLAVVVTLLAGLVSTAAFAAPASAAPGTGTQVAATPLPYELTIRGTNGRAATSVSLPDDSQPVRFTATIASTYQRAGSIIVTVGGRRASSVPAQTGGNVTFDVLPSDAPGNVVEIGIVAQLQWVADCFADDNDEAVLSKGRLTYQYRTAPPTTIGNFLSEGVTSYTVVVPAAASAAEQSAGLTAVSSLAFRYQPPTKTFILATDNPPSPSYLDRQVTFKEETLPAGTSNKLALDATGRLVVSGSAEGLANAAVALASANTQVLDAASAVNVTSNVEFATSSGTVSLADLDTPPVSLVGIGSQQVDIAIDQPMFGQPIENFGIRLRGTASQLPAGAQGRIDFTWNGLMIGSQELSETTSLQQDLAITPAMMQRQNQLGVILSYSPPGTRCAPPGVPARVDLDLQASTVDATPGQSLPPGFNQLPQTSEQAVPVAFGDNGTAPQLLRQAGNLVAALSQTWPQQHTYSVQSVDTVVDSGQSALVVGGTNQLTQELAAPLTTGTWVTINGESVSFGASVTQPLAYIQTFTQQGRAVTLLGYNDAATDKATSAELADKLATYAYENPNGWRALSGQVVVSNGSITALDLQQEVPDKGRTWLIATGIGLAIVVAIVLVLLWLRPRRRKSDM